MTKKESKSMIFFPVLLRWNTFMNLLSDEEAGLLFKNMFLYYINGKTPNFTNDEKLQIIWCDVESWLETSKDNYKAKIQQTSEAGKKSAAKRKESTDVNERQRTSTKAKAKAKEKEKEKEKSISTSKASASATACAISDNDMNDDNSPPLESAGLSWDFVRSVVKINADEATIIQTFENEIKKGKTTNINERNTIIALCRKYSCESVKEAIFKGVDYGAKTLKYIETILKNDDTYNGTWHNSNYNTDEDESEWEG